MERAISASDADQRFSEVLREVEAGETFVVTSRGRAVARISPVDDADQQSAAIDRLLDVLACLPRRSLSDWNRDDLYA